MVIRQGDTGGGGQGYAFVGRSEQHIEFQSAFDNGLSVITSQAGQSRTGIEQTGIKKVRTDPTGLESEFAEAKHVA